MIKLPIEEALERKLARFENGKLGERLYGEDILMAAQVDDELNKVSTHDANEAFKDARKVPGRGNLTKALEMYKTLTEHQRRVMGWGGRRAAVPFFVRDSDAHYGWRVRYEVISTESPAEFRPVADEIISSGVGIDYELLDVEFEDGSAINMRISGAPLIVEITPSYGIAYSQEARYERVQTALKPKRAPLRKLLEMDGKEFNPERLSDAVFHFLMM